MQFHNLLLTIILTFLACDSQQETPLENDDRFLTKIINPKTENLRFYWKDQEGTLLKNFENLKSHAKNQGEKLLFAMNGGMFKRDFSPQGLYIENGKTITPLDTTTGKGNFYLQPNGVFYLTENKEGVVCQTSDFKPSKSIKYATQSGPMLLIDGKMHPAFNQGSPNLHIRNGVGILPNKQLIFAMSKQKVNFFDFAEFFQKMGCKNALYLDGFVSRVYYPQENWVQNDGNFGVMIGVTK